MAGEQHCVACRTEYVAGVQVCADCGGPLQPGLLPEDVGEGDSPEPASEEDPFAHGGPPDTLFTTLPGSQAEFAAKALVMEGIACVLECRGIRRVRAPGRDPIEPLALTLPVNIYLPKDRVQEAQRILDSFTGDEPIGGQWCHGDDCRGHGESRPEEIRSCFDSQEPNRLVEPPPLDLQQEGTMLRFLILLGVAALFAAGMSWIMSHGP